MREPDYRGLAALVIAASGAFGIFVVVPMAVFLGYTMSEVGSQVMVALGGALVGAFSVWMGMKSDRKNGGYDDPTRPPGNNL